MPVGGLVVETPGQPAQFGGEHQTHGYRGTVPPFVTLPPLDGMGESVAVVEDLAQLRFLLVGRDDLGLDGNRAPDQLRQHRARRLQRGLGIGLDQVEDHGSAMNPAFTISAMPATSSLRGNVSSVAISTSTAAG